jgi:hypothetical protein
MNETFYYAELFDSDMGTLHRKFASDNDAIEHYTVRHGKRLQAVIKDGDKLEVIYEVK